MLTKVVVNRSGVRQLLRSGEVRADLERRAHRIASAAGDGHGVDSSLGPNRARAAVYTSDVTAAIAEAKHRNLTSALDAGR